MPSSVESRLCQFIVSDLEWDGSPADLVGDTPLPLPEVLDSEELLEMVTFIEDEFGVEIDDSDIVPEHFSNLPAIARFVDEKISQDNG